MNLAFYRATDPVVTISVFWGHQRGGDIRAVGHQRGWDSQRLRLLKVEWLLLENFDIYIDIKNVSPH